MTTIAAEPEAETSSGALFPPEVESASAAAAARLASLQERWPRGVELAIAAQASIYHSYPYLFLGAFPGLDPRRVEPLSLAASLFADSLFVADDLMDDDPTDRDATTNLVRLQAMQFEGYRILYGLFPAGARFWDRFRDDLALYARACTDERRFVAGRADWSELDQTLALRIAKGKSSLAKFVVAGLAELAGDDAPVGPLTRALDRYYVARQMVDDLSDWRQDLERGYPSLLLARVVMAEMAEGVAGREELARDQERAGRAIYLGGHARYVVKIAVQALTEGEELAAPYPDLLWHRLTARLRARCERLLSELERIAAATAARQSAAPRRFPLSLPAAADPWQETAWAALGCLAGQRRPGPGGETPEAGGAARRRRAAAAGGLLARAFVADALCDADELLGGQLRPLLEDHARHLLDHRPAGGWGWSPVAPGLPADAWHLARVLRLLARIGWRAAIEERCEPLLGGLLERQAPDGALPTWIAGGAEVPCGGPDEVVVADLLAALDVYDRGRFGPAVARGAAWIEARQRPDGSWTSPGVRGPFLPAAAAIGLLAAVRPASPALAHVAEFLRRSQHAHGGWGTETERCDAASSALALLGLARLQPVAGRQEDVQRARRGLQALAALARFDGGRPAAGGTLTAAFTLQAALAWHRLETDAAAAPAVAQEVPA